MLYETKIPEFLIKTTTEKDVPQLIEFINGLAEYEKLTHEVVVTQEVLTESLFVKKTAEAWNTKPASVSAVDADSIISAIKQNPDKSAVFKGCDSAIWNDVYKAVSKMKLHPKLKWNSNTQEISFR